MLWRIGEILVRKKRIDWPALEECLQEQRRTQERIGDILVRKKVISKPLFYQALAEQFNLAFIDIQKTRINPEALKKVPKSVAIKYTLIPIELSNGELIVGISDPLKDWPSEELRNLAKVRSVKKVLCLPEDIKVLIESEYPKT